jgi:ribosomal protein S16
VQLERERIEYWLSQGAKASNAVASILRRNGIVVVRPTKKPRERVRGKKTSVRTRRDAASKQRAEAKAARAVVRKKQKRAAAKAAGAEAKKAE